MSLSEATVPATDRRVLERSDTVLWSLAGDGIVLHNFATHRFLPLDVVGYLAWGYLDGARSVDDVVAAVRARARPPGPSEVQVRELVEALFEHGFVQEASADA